MTGLGMRLKSYSSEGAIPVLYILPQMTRAPIFVPCFELSILLKMGVISFYPNQLGQDLIERVLKQSEFVGPALAPCRRRRSFSTNAAWLAFVGRRAEATFLFLTGQCPVLPLICSNNFDLFNPN